MEKISKTALEKDTFYINTNSQEVYKKLQSFCKEGCKLIFEKDIFKFQGPGIFILTAKEIESILSHFSSSLPIFIFLLVDESSLNSQVLESNHIADSLSLLEPDFLWERKIQTQWKKYLQSKYNPDNILGSPIKFSEVLDSLIDTFILIDSNGIILFINEAGLKTFGYTPKEILGKNISILMPSPYSELHNTYIQKYLNTGIKRIIGTGRELLAKKKDGSTFPIFLSVNELHFEDKIFFIGVIHDIANRKKLEHELHFRNHILQAITECRKFILRAESIDELLKGICNLIYEKLSYEMVWIGLYDVHSNLLLPEAFADNHRWIRVEDLRSLYDRTSPSLKIIEEAIKTSNLIITPKFLIKEHFPELEKLHKNLEISLGVFPLVYNQEILGSLNIYTSSPSGFISEEISFLDGIAKDIVSAITILRNLKKLQETELILTRRTNLLTQVIDSFPNGAITILDKELIVLFAGGDSYNKLFINTKDLIGYKWSDPFFLNLAPEIIPKAAKGETFIFNSSIQDRTFEISFMGIYDLRGEIHGFIHVAKDITELDKMKKEAQEASIAKSMFLATISHELRTPLNGIIGMTGLLLETKLSLTQKKYAETIRTSGETLLMLLNDILDYSKIESGKLELEEYKVSFEKLIEETISLVYSRVKEKGIELFYLIEKNLPEYFLCDGERIKQILMNLLSNAVKFTNFGEVRIRLLQDSSRPSSSLEIPLLLEVSDTGIGIEKDKIAKIMEPFQQSSSTIHRKYGGTGLGLAISLRLSKLMGGRLDVKSELGKGSTFTLSLNLKVKEENKQTPKPSLIQENLLILDEDLENSEYIAYNLEKLGLTTKILNSPDEYTNHTLDSTYKLILLFQYKKLSFTFYLTLIKGFLENQKKVIFVTHVSREDITFSNLYKYNFEVVEKPFLISEIRDLVVNILLGKKAYTKQTSSKLDPNLSKQYPLAILVAEDNLVNQQMLKACLNNMGYLPDIVSNGIEAVQLVKEKNYDLVFMDMFMPEMDGITATKEILNDTSIYKKPIIIAVTANVYEADKQDCIQAGMKDIITKPIKISEFQEKIIEWGGKIFPMKSENEQTFKEYINFETIRELDSIPDPSGGRLYNNLQALFLKNSPKTLEDLKTAIEIEDIPNIKQHAHKLKGMSSNLGGAKLASLLKQFEIEHTNPQKLKEMWPELEETYKKTIEYFEWVANHPPGELPDF